MKERLNYMDGLKFFAAIWIFAVHFISSHASNWLFLWREFPYTLIFKGFTGKLSVCVLGVILGYLAYTKGMKTEKLGAVILKRYVQFVIMGIIINIFGAWNKGYDFTQPVTYASIVVTALTLGKQLASIFWCMRDFFFASVIAYILGKYKVSQFPLLLLIFVLFLSGNVWIAVCLMGALLYSLTDFENSPKKEKFISSPWTQIILFVVSFFAIKRSESNLTYFIQGFCCLFVLIIFSVNKPLKKIFGCKVFAYLGKQSMGIFLLHPFVYPLITDYIYRNFSNLPLLALIAFVVSAVVTIALSVIVVFIINKCSALASQLILYLKDLFLKIITKPFKKINAQQ